MPRDLVPRDRDDLVNHYLRLYFQTSRSPGRHRNAEKRSILQMARNQTDHHTRVSAVEQVGLHNERRPRLTVFSRCRTNDDIAALYLHPEVSASPYQSVSLVPGNKLGLTPRLLGKRLSFHRTQVLHERLNDNCVLSLACAFSRVR